MLTAALGAVLGASCVRAAEPGGPAAQTRPAATTRPAPALHEGTLCEHALGFTFWCPAGWKTIDHDGRYLQIVPREPARTEAGYCEAYYLLHHELEDEAIRVPANPDLLLKLRYRISRMSLSIRSLSAPLKRDEAPREVTMCASEGAVVDWAGTSTWDGKTTIAGRAFVTIIDRHSVALVALCHAEVLKRRAAVVERMFASFRFGKGEVDPSLAGTWWQAGRTDDPPGSLWRSQPAATAAPAPAAVVLRPDGTWTRTAAHEPPASAPAEATTGPVEGRWAAAGNVLFMMWKDRQWAFYTYRHGRTRGGRELRLIETDTLPRPRRPLPQRGRPAPGPLKGS